MWESRTRKQPPTPTINQRWQGVEPRQQVLLADLWQPLFHDFEMASQADAAFCDADLTRNLA